MSVVLEPFGDAALRALLPEGIDAHALSEALRGIPGVIDAVVTEHHALVTFDPAARPIGVERELERRAAMAQSLALSTPAPREHAIGVRYDGPDLEDVARATQLTRAEVVARHSKATYAVTTIGFLPGFAYLRGLDPHLEVPRRASPRPRVPALSVAIAGPYSAVYPFASPGGWHLLGTALGFLPFDPRQGATLRLGDRVRFVEVRP